MFTMGILERYLEIMEVHEEDRRLILEQAHKLAEEEDDQVINGGVIPQLFAGYPLLEMSFDNAMMQRIKDEDPSLLDPLRERARRMGLILIENVISPGDEYLVIRPRETWDPPEDPPRPFEVSS